MKADLEGPSGYPLGDALDFLQRPWELNHALEKLSSRMERTLGVTAQQQLVIRCVGKYPGMTAGQLAGVLHVDPGTVSATLKRLEGKGLVARRRDPRDSRRVCVGLTERGRALDRPVERTGEHAVEQLVQLTNAADLATAKAVVGRLVSLVLAEMGGEDPS